MEWVKGWNAIAAAGIRQKRQNCRADSPSALSAVNLRLRQPNLLPISIHPPEARTKGARQRATWRASSLNSWLISPAADTRISGMKGRGIVRERRR